jgi:maleamate amidohydrolase
LPVWDGILPEEDRRIYESAGFGRKAELGKRPVILVVDVTKAFVGDKPEPILKSIEKFPNSCGEQGWKGVYNIRTLLSVAREYKIPIFYTCAPRENEFALGMWAKKDSRVVESSANDSNTSVAIPREISPQPEDIILEKLKPSPFFGTPLLSYLINFRADTIVVTGCTTSGCIRAAVIDAFSYNYAVMVVEECTFDRGTLSHKVNLFDMDQKYANVVSLEAAKSYIRSIRTFEC